MPRSLERPQKTRRFGKQSPAHIFDGNTGQTVQIRTARVPNSDCRELQSRRLIAASQVSQDLSWQSFAPGQVLAYAARS